MKTKNLSLALLAVVFAVCGAFSSKNVDEINPNVKIYAKPTYLSNWQCMALPVTCATSGPYICKIIVTQSDLNIVVTSAYIATNPTCTTYLYDNDYSHQSYDAGFGDRPFEVWRD